MLDDLAWYENMIAWMIGAYLLFSPYLILKSLDDMKRQNERVISLLVDILEKGEPPRY